MNNLTRSGEAGQVVEHGWEKTSLYMWIWEANACLIDSLCDTKNVYVRNLHYTIPYSLPWNS